MSLAILVQDKFNAIRAHDNVPDDVSETDVMVPETSGQIINDDNANPLDSTSEPHVDLPENEDAVVFFFFSSI